MARTKNPPKEVETLHVPFLETVNQMASQSWGAQFRSLEEAQQAMADAPEKLAAYSVLELIRRLNVFLTEMAPPRVYHHTEKEELSPDDNSKLFPSIESGDRMYWQGGSLSYEASSYLVLSKTDAGHAVICGTTNYPSSNSIATDEHFDTVAGAVNHAALHDFQFHWPRAEKAKLALKALELGADLTPFAAGFSDEEYDLLAEAELKRMRDREAPKTL